MKINTPEHADAVEKIEQAANESGGTIRTDYSGRGMYGKICYGIEGDLVDILMAAGRAGLPKPELDNMGMDSIVYWPRIKGVPSAGDGEDLLE